MAQELLLSDLHRRARAAMGPWQEWIVPYRFHDIEIEYRAVRHGVGVIDWSTMGVLQVDGADRASFLHRVLTQDLAALSPGSGCSAALVTPTAKLLAELIILADHDAHWILADRRRIGETLKTLDHYLITDAVTLADRSSEWAIIALQGPRSVELIRDTLQMHVHLARPLDHCVAVVDVHPIRAIAHSITGQPGLMLMVPSGQAAWCWNRLIGPGAIAVGWDTFNVLRLEAGIPWYGIDMDESNLLPETGLERTAVSDRKGCYVGQEVIARMQTQGSASRKLVGLVCEGPVVPQAGDPIVSQQEPLGELTSACLSPALGQPIAMGYVKRPAYAIGTRVEILREGARLAATIVERPFVRPFSRSTALTPVID